MSLLREIGLFSLTLAGLVVLSRWISRQVQIVVLRLTREEQVAQMAYTCCSCRGSCFMS